MEERSQKDCVGSESADLARYLSKAAATRTPLSVSFELTHRCNFRCIHCYLGDQEAIHKHRHRELDTDRIIRLLDEMVESGTLFLTLTGGDPMLRPDFVRIYEHAVCIGLLVTVFCNGSLLTDDVLNSFIRYPPRVIEVTVYGATRKTFEAVTQKTGSFSACMEGIARLQAEKVRLRLKMIVMTLNIHEFDAVREFSEGVGVPFRHDCSLHPALPNVDNAGRTNCASNLSDPVRFRISPEQAAELDMRVNKLTFALTESIESSTIKKSSGVLYHCEAGKTSYHLDPYGQLQPCLIMFSRGMMLGKEGVQAAWKIMRKEFSMCAAIESFPCDGCRNRDICTGCPSAFALETGSPNQVDTYYCQYAEYRRKEVERLSSTRC
ncbi:MAG: radical SAM protein [Candidatus Electrothrix sp. AR4]|nr:radical SAM protein [Candidatus Electrothrix sp. AR4]